MSDFISEAALALTPPDLVAAPPGWHWEPSVTRGDMVDGQIPFTATWRLVRTEVFDD